MKDKIRKNLIIKSDYEREKSLGGFFLNKHKFYIIGVLLVLVIYRNKEKELAKLMAREEIPIGDPKLRNILGVKATDLIRLKKYETEVSMMTLKLEKELKRINETETFNKKPIKDIQIIKVE